MKKNCLIPILVVLILTSCNSSGGGSTTNTTNMAATLQAIAVTPIDPSIANQATIKFTATGIYSDNSAQDLTAAVIWSSSSPTIASISNQPGTNGRATSLAAGTTTIAASAGTVSGTTILIVTSATLSSLSITPAHASAAQNTTTSFTATGTYSDTTTMDVSSRVTWNSSNTSVATISSSGVASALSAGTTTITATDPVTSKSASAALTVTTSALVSVTVAPGSPVIPNQFTKQFTAIGTYSDSTTQDITSQVTWSSSDAGVAAINNAGFATAVGPGTTYITATDTSTGSSGLTVLTVTSATLSSITVTPNNQSLMVGFTRQFTATGNLSDSTWLDITPFVAWSSSISSVAMISDSGLATALNAGATTISALYRGVTGTVGLPVTTKNVAVSVGEHTVDLKSDGTLWTWGWNNFGQLGYYITGSYTNLPGPVSALSGVAAVSAGFNYTAAVKSDGTVWVWGNNQDGQLGNGTYDGSFHQNPQQVGGVDGIRAVSAGGSHVVALKSDGTVWTWGENDFGQLGYVTSTPLSGMTPSQVGGLTGVVAVAAGARQSAALKSDGTVWTWGDNGNGNLGYGSYDDFSHPVPVQVPGLSSITAIASGTWYFMALKSDGTVWTWGTNNSGVLGYDTTPLGFSMSPAQVNNLTGVAAIAAGNSHAVAIMPDGTLWTWGSNNYGQLGNGSYDADSHPTPALITGLSGVNTVAAGYASTVALKSDGRLWGWGNDENGQLGLVGINIVTPTELTPF